MSSRRGFIRMFGAGGFAVLALEALWSTVRFARAPVSYGPPMKRALGEPARFPTGATEYVDGAKVFVMRDAKGLRALSATCTHLGCTVRENPDKDGFTCPCHGSRFDREGRVVGGPAPQSLTYHALEVDKQGRLVVDLAREVGEDDRLRDT
ncbi:MAG: ubiquinol-cytochrome c reductase iron-sulfur subunit [Myxococcota bacterium]